jgi:hypothetical protein
MKIIAWFKELSARRFARRSPGAAEALIECWSDAGKRLRMSERLYPLEPLTVGQALVIREEINRRRGK